MTYTFIDLSRSSAPDVSPDLDRLKEHIAKAYGISVVMILENADHKVFETITQVLQEPFVHQVVLVDNGNVELVKESLLKLCQLSQKIHVIRCDKPIHQGEALNEAARDVAHPYVLVLDQHYRLMENGTWRLLLSIQSLKGDWVLGVKRQSQGGTDLPSCTYLPTPAEAYKQLLGQGLTIPMSVARSSVMHPYYVPAANAAAVFMPATLLSRLSGWDKKTTVWGGYADFCMRVHQAGGHVYYLPEVTVTECDARPRGWRYQWDSARGVMSYMGKHHHNVSRLLRWPLSFLLGACCFFTPLVNTLKSKWFSGRPH